MSAITVITVTRGRPALLARAIASVQAQDLRPSPRHLVLIDDCPATDQLLQRRGFPNLERLFCERGAGDQDGPARLARLRNLAVSRVTTEWIAFLDDDNEYAADHLSSLLARAEQAGAGAAFSWRTLHNPDGSPYLAERFPWTRAGEDQHEVYAALAQRGIVQHGSPLMRDTADGLDNPAPFRTVDANEWLLRTSLVRSIPFSEQYSLEDAEQQRYDDGKLLLDLLELGEPLVCSGRATVRYYLGGLSNRERTAGS